MADYHKSWKPRLIVLTQVSPDFPWKSGLVLSTTPILTSKWFSWISSQIDVDRMDYLYWTPLYWRTYGQFDLTRILRLYDSVENGIALNVMVCMPWRIMGQSLLMYMQVYFHPASRASWKFCCKLTKRATFNEDQKDFFKLTSPNLLPFLKRFVIRLFSFWMMESWIPTSKAGWPALTPS